MSTKGVYTALSGAMAQGLRMNTIANNIANVNTPGFKRDAQIFQEFLTANEKPPEVIQVPRDLASIESFYDMQGGDKSFVDASGTFTEHSQGSIKTTGNPFDIAIDGKGFFEIATPSGIKYTRAGNFTLDGKGQLVTKEGFPVLQVGAGEPESRTIRLSGSGSMNINDEGFIFEGEVQVGKLSLIESDNLDALQKVGGSLYAVKSNMDAKLRPLTNASVKQGFLESSNVNIVQEMTDMIATQRVFESTQKAISAYDSMTDKLVNSVGKLNG